MFCNRNAVCIWYSSRCCRNISSLLNNLVKGTSIHNQVFDYWKRLCTPRLYNYCFSIFEVTHCELASCCTLSWTMRSSVYVQATHSTDAFSAIAIKDNRMSKFVNKTFIENIQHLQKRTIRRDILYFICFKMSFSFSVGLTPYF